MLEIRDPLDPEALLPGDVPVPMPELPLSLPLTTAEQFKAFAEPVRTRILGIIQNQPATAKQIADRLGIAPGTVGHHLQVLEAAGLAKIVARRLVRGIVAKYYTRTARIFNFDLPREVEGDTPLTLHIVDDARDELAETMAERDEHAVCTCGFPHARLSPERAKVYEERVGALIDDLTAEQPDPNGQVFGLVAAFFFAPGYLQANGASHPETAGASGRDPGSRPAGERPFGIRLEGEDAAEGDG
jgi:DNA-binding transcriptional ArsR family regulator